MAAKQGDGLIFVNCMEKLTMNAPQAKPCARALSAALDAGIDGITMSAGLHLGSFALIADHPRFRDAKLGIIVSSVRALQLFLRKISRLDRLPDYIIVEGPAGRRPPRLRAWTGKTTTCTPSWMRSMPS